MRVEIVGKTIGIGKYAHLNDEEIIAAIARHGTIKDDNGKLVKYLMDNQHWSPLDMVNYLFEIETSLSIGRQLLRHSSIKPQEFSGRYAEAIGFESIELRREDTKNRQSSTEVFNPKLENLHPVYDDYESFTGLDTFASQIIENHLDVVQDLYKSLLKAGVAKECARMILPNCTTTILTFNGTLRSWLALLNVRCDRAHAQKECSDIADLIGEALEKELPRVFSSIQWRIGLFM